MKAQPELRIGDRILGNMTITRILGAEGVTGEADVYLVTEDGSDVPLVARARQVRWGGGWEDFVHQDFAALVGWYVSSHELFPKLHGFWFCQETGRLFTTSEYIDGETLADRVDRGGFVFRQLVIWWRDIAHALAHLEEHQLYHTDIHDKNFIVDRTDRIKCVDLAAIRIHGLGPKPQNYDDNIIWPIITYDTLRAAEQFGKLIHDEWNAHIQHQRAEPIRATMTEEQRKYIARERRTALSIAEDLFLSSGAILMFDSPGMGPEMEAAEGSITDVVKYLRWAKKADHDFSYAAVYSQLEYIFADLIERFGPLTSGD